MSANKIIGASRPLQLAVLLTVFTVSILIVLAVIMIPTSINAAAGHNLSGYAWSDNIGWINLNSGSYGVNVRADGVLEGYAWSDNIGWITFNSTSPNQLSGCPSGSCEARFDRLTGDVSGWARVCAGMDDSGGAQTVPNNSCSGSSRPDGWDGWIQLRGAANNYGISVTNCDWSGWAWGGNVVGWISFGGAGHSYAVTGTGNACRSTSTPTLIIEPSSATVSSMQTGLTGTEYSLSRKVELRAYYDADGPEPGPRVEVTDSVSWSSNNTAKATMTTPVGTVISGASTGDVAISAVYTASGGPITGVATVSVAKLTIPTKSSIIKGMSHQFTASAVGIPGISDVTSASLWEAPAYYLAFSPTETGKATGNNLSSNVEVKAKYPIGDGKFAYGITNTSVVSPPAGANSLRISPYPSATVRVTEMISFLAYYTDLFGVEGPALSSGVSWSTSSSGNATIAGTGTGVATGVAAGSTNIRASYSSVSSQNTALTVENLPPPACVIKLYNDETELSPIIAGSPLKFTVPLITRRLVYVRGGVVSVNNVILLNAEGIQIASRDTIKNVITLQVTSPTVIGKFTGTIAAPLCTSADFPYEISEITDPGEI